MYINLIRREQVKNHITNNDGRTSQTPQRLGTNLPICKFGSVRGSEKTSSEQQKLPSLTEEPIGLHQSQPHLK